MGTTPIFTKTPVCSGVNIPYTNALLATDGTSIGAGDAKSMYVAYTCGANGSFIDKIRFTPVTTVQALTQATNLNIFLSTVGPNATAAPAVSATTTAETGLVMQIQVPSILVGGSNNPTPFFETPLNISLPSGYYVHVAQMVAGANATAPTWQCTIFGADY